jgi:hypothetical protein
MNLQQAKTFWYCDQIMRQIADKVDAMPPAQRAEQLEWLTDLEADYQTWKRAAQRGKRTFEDIQAELRVGVELMKRTPKGWVTVR